MKKRIAVFTAFIGLCYVLLTSYTHGTAISGFNCTGAKGSVTNCAGSSCHGNGSGTTAYIKVESAPGVIVGSYTPGGTYTVTVGAENTLLLPKFGFQFAAVVGVGTAQTQAGTYSSYPLYVTGNYVSGIIFVEQTDGIDAVIPGSYKKSFKWTAPSVGGLGIVTMYLTMLAVNGNNVADTLDVSNNVSITLLPDNTSGIADHNSQAGNVTAWPNPVSNTLHLSMDNSAPGNCTIAVYDLSGKLIASETNAFTSLQGIQDINTSGWMPGMYKVVIGEEGMQKTITVVKQ